MKNLHYTAFVLAIGLLLLWFQVSSAQDQVLEREPDWTLEIFTFADHNENNIWDPDSNEDFVRSYGRITYTASGTGRNWEARTLPAQINIPYSVDFRIDPEAVSYNVYDCQTVYGRMLDSGTGYAEVPCHPRSWLEWVNHVWIGFITGE